jgi:hypothetical protein
MELRTPLSAILGWTQVLLRDQASKGLDEHKRAIEVIERNARAQVKLIDDLLDLSRVMAGKLRLDLHQVSFAGIVEAAVHSARPSAEVKGIRLKAILGSSSQDIISADSAGIGIPANYLPHVFDRFSQKDSSTTRAFGGLGLGLAICKQLVELHGGAIRAASQGEGMGATFSVQLPLSIAQLNDQGAPRIHPTAETQSGEMLSLPRLEGVHVFAVDDEPDARELLRRVLEDQSTNVTSFASAEDALAALKMTKPTVLVCDIGMPKMDGYQLIRQLRAEEARRDRVPALALTAFARA